MALILHGCLLENNNNDHLMALILDKLDELVPEKKH